MNADISITRAQPPKAHNPVNVQLVVPGEIITTESGYMRYRNIPINIYVICTMRYSYKQSILAVNYQL